MKNFLHAKFLAVQRRVGLRLTGDFDPYPAAPAGTALSPWLGNRAAMVNAPLRLAWQSAAISDPAEWQKAAHQKLVELTGYPVDRPTPREVARLAPAPVSGITRQTFYLRLREDWDAPVHVLVPEDDDEPRPVMICLQGTNSGAHLSWGAKLMPPDPQKVGPQALDYAVQAVSHGYAAVCLEQASFGERRERRLPKRSPHPTIDAAHHALLMGRTLIGDHAGDASSVVDWLVTGGANDQRLNTSRIYLMGGSLGGTAALYTTALDTRVAGVLASGCIGFIRQTIGARGDASGHSTIPGILNWMELDDICALVAPRLLLGISGDKDHIWPFSGVKAVIDSARRAYATIGVDNRIAAVEAKGPHRFYPDLAWPAFQKLIEGGRPDAAAWS